jgi:large subunit ribosomal protein L23
MPRHVPQATSVVLEPHQVIVKPLVTEKGMHRSTRNNAYAFEINRGVTKDWKKAIVTLDAEHRINFF